MFSSSSLISVVFFAKQMSFSQITSPSCFLTRKSSSIFRPVRHVKLRENSVGDFGGKFLDRVKGQTAFFEEMIEDEDGLVDDRLPTTSRGLWAASETERTLKAILSFAKVKRMDPELVEEGNTFMELFENWKKEYKVCTDANEPCLALEIGCA